MEEERLYELLANAVVCFRRCMSPFSPNQLIMNDVKADECRDLSHELADIIEDELSLRLDPVEVRELIEKAEKKNDEAEK